MLQIDHVYEFFYRTLFTDFAVHALPNGGVFSGKTSNEIKIDDQLVFNHIYTTSKILFVDQEPIATNLVLPYIKLYQHPSKEIYNSINDVLKVLISKKLSYLTPTTPLPTSDDITRWNSNPAIFFKEPVAIAVSEKSNLIDRLASEHNLKVLYYFFHGFAALDWFRGFYSLNYNKNIQINYQFDFVTFNRLVVNDRSYRCYFISLLVEKKLINKGQISFGSEDNNSWRKEIACTHTKLSKKAIVHINQHLISLPGPLIIDSEDIKGCASADIPRCIDNSLWHIVTETVFYYNKLHLTEKIFKPIVMKQPFMLLAAHGNLAYLKSYGFKTFDGIIDERYDTIVNPDARTEAVVDQLNWYCNLSSDQKLDIIKLIEPIVEFNFHWFYNEFKHRITSELLDNSKFLFNELSYDDSLLNYDNIYRTLVN
jgi:hypothetical protein